MVSAGADTPTGTFDVAGGRAGAPDSHTTLPGAASRAGQISVSDLTDAQRTALPPPPASVLQPIGAPPTLLPVQAANQVNEGMHCAAGDLDVGKGVTRRLDGVQRFAHICVHDGGALVAAGPLALIATTISVDAASSISAHGVGTKPVRHRPLPAAGIAGPRSWHPPAGHARRARHAGRHLLRRHVAHAQRWRGRRRPHPGRRLDLGGRFAHRGWGGRRERG